MSFHDLLGKVDVWTPDEVRAFLKRCHPDDVQLIDIRSLQDFATHHLPGAIRIAAEDLPLRCSDLDSSRTTIVYCTHGSLSKAAAQILSRAGFADVHVLGGGLHAWQWGTSAGLPEETAEPLRVSGGAADQALFAWHVEEATRCFYEAMATTLPEPEIAALFAGLVDDENRHKETLKALWEGLSGRVAAADFPAGLTVPATGGQVEGGMDLKEVLAWAARSPADAILDFAMALELSAYDQYLFLSRNAGNPDSERLFEVMADEERRHLDAFAAALAGLGQRL